jgi:probable phosphoglycerate mutase
MSHPPRRGTVHVVEIYLIRHGQPDWTPGQVARNDPELTELGQEQAKRAAHRIAAVEAIDELWVSPMTRARQTADPVASETGITPEIYPWLEEIQNPPTWEGSPAEEIEKALHDANFRSMEEMWDGLPGGESFRAFHRRVVTGLEETLAAHGIRPMRNRHPHLWDVEDPGRRVAVVAHAGTNAVVLGRLLGLEPVPWEWDRFRQPHSGVSRLTMDRISEGWGFSLRQLGDVGHLEEPMVTE